MADASPQVLQGDMERLEREIELMLNDWSAAEDALIRNTSAIERLKAPQRVSLKREPPVELGPKPTREDLDAWLLDWCWSNHERLMAEQLNAEALVAAYDTKYKVARTALSSKQSRLKAETQALPSAR